MAFSGQGDRNEDQQGPDGERPREDEAFEDAGADDGAAFDQPRQLDLGDEDVRLPWLEGEDEEYEDERSSGTGQGLLLAVLGLIAIGLIVGGVFWALRGKPERALVADGGVIAAPKQPYKTKPENPGGNIVAGTGDTSFAVAEGERRPPTISQKSEAPKPGFESIGKPGGKTPDAGPTEAVSGVGVQVGAYASREAAEAGWNTLTSQYPDLSGIKHRVVQGQADIGTVYRLQAVPGDLAAARTLCGGMKSAGLSCQVKK